MRYLIAFLVLALAWIEQSAGFEVPKPEIPKDMPAAPEMPPPWTQYKNSRSCQKSLGRCFKQLGNKLADTAPHLVQNCFPCESCEAAELSSVETQDTYARLCCKEKVNTKEIHLNITCGFSQPLSIHCKNCAAKTPFGVEIKGDLILNWPGVSLYAYLYKPDWSGTKVQVRETKLLTIPTPDVVGIVCKGDSIWNTACETAHKGGMFSGICFAVANALFPAVSNVEFARQEADETGGLGAMMKCSLENDLPGTASEELTVTG